MAEEVATREIDKELGFTPWLAKINERVAIALLCMKDKTDKIQESDYEILKALHGVWFYGEVPIFQTITIPNVSNSRQQTLFSADNLTVTDNFDDARDKILDGTTIAEVVIEP